MFFIPIVCFIAAALYYSVTEDKLKSKIWKSAAITMSVEYALLIILKLFISYNSVSIPILPIILLCILPYAVKLLPERFRGLLKKICIVSVSLFVIEIVVFNGKSIFSTEDFQQHMFDAVEITGDVSGTQINGNSIINLNNVPDYARCMTLSFQQTTDEIPEVFYVKLTMRDDSFSEKGVIVQEKMVIGKNPVCQLSFQPYGKIRSLSAELTSVTRSLNLTSVSVATCLPFAFNSLRFWLLFTIAVIVIVIIEFKLYLVHYKQSNPLHLLCIGSSIVLCLGLCSAFIKPDDKPYTYEGKVNTADPWEMIFDGFQKGQVWLDLEADTALESIENVYSNEQREKSGAFAYWDLAYFKGKYYCYFGVTPVLVYYYPYYWIHNQLPSLSMAVYFFSYLSILFFALALISAVRMFNPHPNLLLLILSIPASIVCIGVYFMMCWAGTYHLPMVTGLCMLSLCLWTGMKACMSEKMPVRMILLFISGLSLALCMGARPSMALGSAVLIPLYIGILLNKRQKLKLRLGQAVCFIVPMCLGAAGLMYYNYIRFGSPFDFGASYQLTVSDIHANKITLSNIWGAIEHYFIIPPRNRTTFPFFEPDFGKLNNYQHYVYLESTIGWLNYPMIIVGLLGMYPAIKDNRAKWCRNIHKTERRYFILLCCIMAFLIAWMDFSSGGVNQRYLYDIAPLLFIACTIAVLNTGRKAEKNHYWYGMLCSAIIITFIIGSMIIIEIPNSNLQKHCPELYNSIEDMVIFWQ